MQPGYSDNPNFHILRMLSVAGANVGETFCHTSESSLKSLTRSRIRQQLKQIHPESNHYFTLSKLGLPHQLQSYLLFDTPSKDNHGLNKNEKEFLLKASKGDGKDVLNLINAGLDVNIQDENGMTALMMACEVGCVPLVEWLIKAGAAVNIQNIFGNTALICATFKRQNECVRKLLECGANTSIQGKDGLTALMHAARTGDVNCLQTLLDGGADPNIPNDDETATKITRIEAHGIQSSSKGTTAIIYASRHGKADCVKKLIEAGADVNNASQDKNREGNTPLMAAIEKGNIECVRELIKAGVDLNIPEINRMRALITTSSWRQDNCFSELMKAGAEVISPFLASIARKLFTSENAGTKNLVIKDF